MAPKRSRLLLVVCTTPLLLPAGVLTGDEMQLTTGGTYQGKVIGETPEHVEFEARLSSGNVRRKVPVARIRQLIVNGKKRTFGTPSASSTRAQTAASGTTARTRSETLALIADAGGKPPKWWDTVPLDYPKSLDLSWAKPPPGSGWTPSRNMGQYLWSVINENPGRWKKGAKLMHHVAKVNERSPDVERQAWNALGHIHADLLEDYARGAYWWQKGGGPLIGLANCYWQLGCKPLAVETLNKVTVDGDRYGAAIRLWADMGEGDKALELAERSARAGNPAAAYLAAGNVCRTQGRFKQAVAYFEKVLAVRPAGRRDWKWQKGLARSAINAIKSFELLDLTRVPDGTHAGTALAFAGDLTVAVTLSAGRITGVRVTKHKDKQYYSAISDTTRQIVEKQSLRDIDGTTGATVTSDAIVNACAKALVEAGH